MCSWRVLIFEEAGFTLSQGSSNAVLFEELLFRPLVELLRTDLLFCVRLCVCGRWCCDQQYEQKLTGILSKYSKAFLVHADNVTSKQFQQIRAVSLLSLSQHLSQQSVTPRLNSHTLSLFFRHTHSRMHSQLSCKHAQLF
jgi:hypothetical protein